MSLLGGYDVGVQLNHYTNVYVSHGEHLRYFLVDTAVVLLPMQTFENRKSDTK